MTPPTPEPALSGSLIVDAVEGGLARVELDDGSFEDWPLASLPRGVREGDVIRLSVEGGDLNIKIDQQVTEQRRQAAQSQLDLLNHSAPAGEIDL